MAASIILAGREAGREARTCRDAVAAFLLSYRTQMQLFARMPVLELARFMVHRLQTVAPIAQILQLAERATPLHSLEALTIPRDTRASTQKSKTRIFRSAPPDLTRIHGATARGVLDSLNPYAETLQPERRHFLAQYTPLDVAFKVVGTGSVGLRDYCIYMQGNSAADPLFLQIKEESTRGQKLRGALLARRLLHRQRSRADGVSHRRTCPSPRRNDRRAARRAATRSVGATRSSALNHWGAAQLPQSPNASRVVTSMQSVARVRDATPARRAAIHTSAAPRLCPPEPLA